MFGNVLKHGLSCLRYYVKNVGRNLEETQERDLEGLQATWFRKSTVRSIEKKIVMYYSMAGLRSTLKFTIYNLGFCLVLSTHKLPYPRNW